MLRRFGEFCLVDLQLSKQTVKQHIYNIREFLAWLKQENIDTVDVEDIRSFLLNLKDGNPYTYANMLKALQRFFSDFLARPDLVQSFKFPNPNPTIKRVPSKEELKKFYGALKDQREKAIFLLITSSGLRRRIGNGGCRLHTRLTPLQLKCLRPLFSTT